MSFAYLYLAPESAELIEPATGRQLASVKYDKLGANISADALAKRAAQWADDSGYLLRGVSAEGMVLDLMGLGVRADAIAETGRCVITIDNRYYSLTRHDLDSLLAMLTYIRGQLRQGDNAAARNSSNESINTNDNGTGKEE